MFLLHWGKKRVEKVCGFVADFCPICRGSRAFRILRVGSALAFNEVALSQGKLVGHLRQCTECSLRQWADPARYRSMEKCAMGNFEQLTKRTFPQLPAVYAERLALERGLAAGRLKLSPSDRAALLAEPFVAVSTMVDERFAASTALDLRSGIALAGTFLIPGTLFMYSCLRVRGPAQDTFLIVTGISLLACIAWTLLELHLAPFRFVRNRIAPMLGRALRPLGPGQREIEQRLQQCRESGKKLGKVLKAEYVWRAMQLGS